MSRRGWSIVTIAFLCGGLAAIMAPATTQAAGPVKDELGVVTLPKGAPIVVGGIDRKSTRLNSSH